MTTWNSPKYIENSIRTFGGLFSLCKTERGRNGKRRESLRRRRGRRRRERERESEREREREREREA